MMTHGPPKGGIELPFDTVHEGWSIYKTKDGAVIKMKLILLKLLLTDVDESGNPLFAAGSNLIFAVTVPHEMKGAPNDQPVTQKQIQDSLVESDIPFETVKEEWNTYNAEGAVVNVKPIATVISRSSLFDGNGDPIYYIQYQPIVKGDVAPEVRRKFLKIKREKLPKVKGNHRS